MPKRKTPPIPDKFLEILQCISKKMQEQEEKQKQMKSQREEFEKRWKLK